MSDSRPNIFQWATSELSQDAFICWLLAWVNHHKEEEKDLRATAIYFLTKLTGREIPENQNIKIQRQYKNIDILVKINDGHALLIEDKTQTKNHSNQLERYYEALSSEYQKDKIVPVYLKTGDQGEYHTVKKTGYKLFLRSDFIDVLEFAITSGVKNNILLDFYHHLMAMEQSFQSYKTLPVPEWRQDSRKGFYTELAKRLGGGAWDYVPQKNGGFWAFYWFWRKSNFIGNGFDYYLQLEQAKFCFKVKLQNRSNAEEVRQYFRPKLFEKAREHHIDLYQNGRIGNYMTIAALREPYLKTNQEGFIDLDKTVELIQRIERMVGSI